MKFASMMIIVEVTTQQDNLHIMPPVFKTIYISPYD